MKDNGTGSLALARRIRAAGISIYIPEDDEKGCCDRSSDLLIYQFGGVNESLVFDLHGGAGFIIWLTITVKVPRFAIAAFDLELPWEGTVHWLEDPRNVNVVYAYDNYKFSDKYRPEFGRSEVLNHLADVRRKWSRDDSLKGVLLGTVDQPIPEEIKHGAMISGTLIISDQFWQKYRLPVELWADRTAKTRRSRSGIPRRGRLFDHPDPGFERVPLEEEAEAKKWG